MAAVSLPASAAAQDENGVFVDPDSPTGKEYALPAEDARRQSDPNAADDTGRRKHGSRTAPPFGVGVGDGEGPSGGGDGTGGDAGASGGADDGGSGQGKSGDGADATSTADRTARASTSSPGAPPGGGGTLLTILGVGAGVVLAGVAGGAMVRRQREDS